MVRADEAAGICAKLGAAGTTRTANRAKGAIERGKLADINTPLVLVRSSRDCESQRRQHSRTARYLPPPLSLSNECSSKREPEPVPRLSHGFLECQTILRKTGNETANFSTSFRG